jgi:DNA-directed RNA polymerase specialized sigma24 family protein
VAKSNKKVSKSIFLLKKPMEGVVEPSGQDLLRLHHYGIALCGDYEEAYDLLQTDIEKVLRSRSSAVSTRKISYLYATLWNCFIDSVRARRSLEDLVVDREGLKHILGGLSPRERELLCLHPGEEQITHAISETAGKPRGTISCMMYCV